ncbi:MAG TPA: carboxypeptidase regulatory-like domain-containing protein [Pyrinomonadaceae bacterium]
MSKFRINSWLVRTTLLLAALLLAAPFTSAQVTTGNLQGVVLDQNKAAVAGATVKITNKATGITRETTTNAEGFYRVTNLVPGDQYTVEVSAQGFSPAAVNGVAVRLATENSADVALTVGEVGGTVVVTDAQPLIENTQSQLSQSYSPRQLTQLPFNGGSIDNLALLTPGVVTPGDTDFANGTGISANGNRGRSNNFQIDGQDNNDNSVTGPSLTLTNTEAIGEFQVITNSFSAEFGRNSGAQINTITKPGTNEFHGTLFEYHNNQSLDALNNAQKVNAGGFQFLARNGFSQFAGLANRNGRDPYKINKFGGSIGGPIKKNKAFFFFTYQGTYQRGEAVANGLNTGQFTFDAPSALLARQLFPNAATALLTSSMVGGGPAFVQGQGTFLLAPPVTDVNGDGIPDAFLFGPNNPVGNTPTANFLQPSEFVRDGAGVLRPLYTGEPVRLVKANSTANEIITREDFNLTDKDTLSTRYIFNRTVFPIATGRALAGALFDVPSRNHNLGVTYTRTLSSKLVNEARFNYSNLYVAFGDPNGAAPGPQIGFSGQRDFIGNFTSLALGGQNVFPQDRKVVVFQEQDTVSATIGNHALKFGADMRQQRTKNFFLPNFLGAYVFRGSNNSGTVPANTFYDDTGAPLTGQPATAFENLILNRPRDISFALGSPRRDINQNDYFFFIQDDWRIRPTLTLNLGLRYEISTQPFNALIDQLNAREADPNSAIFNQAFPLSTRTLNKLPLDKNNFGPRVGFAWSPNLHFLGERFTNGRTVLRGGFGVAYDPSYFNIVNNTVTAAPFVGTGTIRQNNPGTAGQMLGIPFLPTTTAQLNTTPGTNNGDPRLFNQTRVADDFRNPYTMSYNFGIQQEIWKNTVVEARYVGSRIVGQFQSVNANPDLRFLARAGCDLTLFPGADPATCGGRFTHGIIAPGASVANSFNSRPGTNGNGRLDPNFGPARLRLNGASGTYNGLQTRLDTRFSDSLTMNANYTWSKTIDNASEIFGSLGGGQTIAFSQDPFDITNGERGLSAFHQKHSFNANFIYELPWYKEQRGWEGKLLGGYQLSGFILLGSGRPYTVQQIAGSYDPTFDVAFSGSAGPVRPFYGNPNAPIGTIAFSALSAQLILGDGRPDPALNQWVVYNTLSPGSQGTVVTQSQALQQARLVYNDFATYTALNGALPFNAFDTANIFKSPYGDVGRNTFDGLPFYQVNLAVFKTTNLTEKTKLEFRVEAANLLNHRNFGVPTAFTEFSFVTFGTSTNGIVGPFQNPGANAGSSRSVRLGLRFIF